MTSVFFENKHNPITENVTDVSECLAILANIYSKLQESPTIIGISASQIGFNKRIAAIKYKNGFLNIINPIFIYSEEPFVFKKETFFDIHGVSGYTNRQRGFIIDNGVIDGNSIRRQNEYYYVDSRYEDMDSNNIGVYVQQMLNIMDGFAPKIMDIGKRTIKQNRNSLCACGSGKKYKKCCMR